VYRIVQEALTNVLKHGGPAAMASVELSYGNTTLDVKISDTGRGVIADLDGTNTGNGLVGMRERVELSDGTMAAGPQPGGGYVLTAMIPLDSQMRRSRVVSAEQPTPPSSMTITVAVVDDQALMRDAYTMILNVQDDLRVVGDAESGQAGVDLCRRTNPDIVLMDVRMPNMDGIEAAKIICNDPHISTKVLMLTTFDLDEYVYAAMRAGANGFLLKDTSAKELADAVRIIAQGNALLAPSVTKRLIEEFANRTEPHDNQVLLPADLTEREHEPLQLLARGMSNREIAEQMFVGEATAKTHVSRLLTKLGVRYRVQAVVLAYESGIVQPGSGLSPD
jgi:DNA-binding NarL/FixJ family response regulator